MGFRIGRAVAFATLACVLATTAPAKTKPQSKKPVKTAVTPARKTSKKSTLASVRARSQATPTPDRYKQIQEALVAKGYLSPDQASGQWNDASVDALKRFQATQNIESTGRINSLSLIALGLGPKHDTSRTAAVPQSAPVTTAP